MAHNETRNGLNETERLPRTWSRSTVADGQWMQKNTLGPYRNSDWFLASAIDGLLDKDDELTQAIADEAAARLAYDGILSGRCDFLYTSASKLREDLTTETSERQEEDAATLRDAKDYANDASAYALSEAKTYADAASSFLDKRIDGVSSTFDTYVAGMNTWKTGVETWSAGINDWINETDPKLTNLQSQIDAFENATDVADVVPTSGSLNGYEKRLTPGAVIKVLSAGPGNDQQFYYRNKLTKTSAGPFSIENFDVLGSVQPYYSKSETYSRSETSSNQQLATKFNDYYTTSQLDTKLSYKLDTSAEFITDAQHVTEVGKILSIKRLKERNNWFDIAARCDYNGDDIRTTYMYASAGYKKNETSGKDQLSDAFDNKLDASAAMEGHLVIDHQGGAPTKYDFGDLWYEYGFMTPPEETKIDDDQQDVIIYAYPKDDRTYSARKYIGCFKRRKEIQLYNKVIEAWPNTTILPEFERYPNTFFII